MLRSAIAGALALVSTLPAAAAATRPGAYARMECVGLYCRIVPAPPPRPVAERKPRAWCGWWLRHQVGRGSSGCCADWQNKAMGRKLNDFQ